MGLLLNLVPWWGRWLAIGALCLALIAFGWVKRGVHDQNRCDALQASYEAFKAKVAGEGIAAQERAKAIGTRQKEVNDATVKGLQTDLAAIRGSYASAVADLGRVRSQSNTRGRALSELARSSLAACPGQVSELSGRLDALERGNLQILEHAQLEQAKYIKLWDDWTEQAKVK